MSKAIQKKMFVLLRTSTLRFIINGVIKLNGGGFKVFEKLLNCGGGGQNKRGGWEQSIKEKRQI